MYRFIGAFVTVGLLLIASDTKCSILCDSIALFFHNRFFTFTQIIVKKPMSLYTNHDKYVVLIALSVNGCSALLLMSGLIFRFRRIGTPQNALPPCHEPLNTNAPSPPAALCYSNQNKVRLELILLDSFGAW